MLLEEVDVESIKLPSCRAWLLERPDFKMTRAVEDGVSYGYIIYSNKAIGHVYVHPDARRSGIAALLVSRISNILKCPVTVALNATDEASLKLFVSCGYRPIGSHDELTLFVRDPECKYNKKRKSIASKLFHDEASAHILSM